MVPIVTQNSLHPSSTSSIIARHLLDSMVQGKTTEADAPTNHLNAMWTVGAPTSITFPFFTSSALSVATLPLYLALGQAPNNVGLRTWYRKNRWTIKLGQGMFDTANIGKIPDNNWLP